MSEQIIETHPLEPWLPENARLLMCGTFPPAKTRWSMDFYYPNFINDMWRVFGLILHGDKDYFVDLNIKSFRLDRIKRMLREKGIALSDTGREVQRLKGNASDKWLNIIRPIDLEATLEQIPKCIAVATTGEKAAQVIAEQTSTPVPKVGESVVIAVGRRVLRHWRMPSTSRAYPLPLTSKAAIYETMLRQTEII